MKKENRYPQRDSDGNIYINGYKLDTDRHYVKMNIAGLKTAVAFDGDRMKHQTGSYVLPDDEYDLEEADIIINVPVEYVNDRCTGKYEELSFDLMEYVLTGSTFNKILLDHGGVMLHSSAVVLDGVAYLFSADSGTGKSTHTQLWLEHFGDRAFIINDDKPVLRKVDGDWYVFGTPWSGKSDLNVNTKAKVGAIIFLERSKKNYVCDISIGEAIPKFIKQTIRKIHEDKMEKLLKIMGHLLTEVPLYKFGCNISDDAVVTIYNRIMADKEKKNED